MKAAVHAGVVAVLLCINCFAQKQQGEAASLPKLDRMPEALETHFALSAAPPHLRDSATVYLLDPAKGYAP